MTPPAVAAAPRARTRAHSRRATPPPRRVSGPVRGRAAVAGPPPLALRLGGAVHGLAEHRLLERIIRGRAWIGILAVGLIGIVFMQVSMLRLNAGIGRAVDQATKLERENAAMRATLSELTSGDRIEAEAAKLGFVLPPPGAARFLDARGFDPARALASIQLPSHLAPLPVGTASTVSAASTVAPLPATGVAPDAAATATAPAPGTTTTATAPPATATTTPPATAPASTTQAAPPAPGTAGAATAAPAAAPASSTTAPAGTGGASAGGAG